jgi:hypothetical protein
VSAALATLLLATAGLSVRGEGRDGCPSAAEVSSRLGALLPEGDEPGGLLVMDGETGALRVRLLSPQGAVREQRRLDLRGSCAELADAVATVAVAWQSALRSDDLPAPVLSIGTAPPALAPRPVAVTMAPRPAPRPWRDSLELAVGFHAAAGAKGFAPGLSLAGQAPLGRGFSWSMELATDWPRTQFTDGKRWTWLQASLVAAPSYRMATTNFFFDVRVGLSSDVTVATSEALGSRDSYKLIPPSVLLGLRVAAPRSDYLPWVGVTFSTQLTSERISPIKRTYIEPEPWTLGLALGASFEVERFR